MKTYELLSKIPFLKRYSFKLLFVALLGMHIPLIAVYVFIQSNQGNDISPISIIICISICTLTASVITLTVLNNLLAPLVATKTSLERYSNEGEIPNFPTNYTDDAGMLMRNVQNTILKTESMLSTQQDITALLAHDLRTPLTEIIGVAQIIDPADRAEHELLVNQIVTSGENLLEMFESILTMTKLDTLNQLSIHKTPHNLHELTAQIIDQYSGQLKTKNLQISNEINPETLIKVHKAFFTHAINHLISNAIKFSPEKNIITLSSMRRHRETILFVVDRGIGLVSGTEHLIFNRFTEYGRPGTHNEKSLGLGLYLTKRIVELHNGQIEVLSHGQNKGTTFKVRIPDEYNKI